MLRTIRDKNIWLIYATIFLVGVAYGIYVSLLAINLDTRGFSKHAIGSLASWFAFGIITFSIPAGAMLRRFSAKRTLTASLVGYGVCAAIFPYLTSYYAIGVTRFFDGAFSVCVWVSCETILLIRAERAQKALVTSLYAMSIAVGYIVGPIAAKLVVAAAAAAPHTTGLPSDRAFITSSALAAVAALLVAVALDHDPPAIAEGAHGTAHTKADEADPASPEPDSSNASILWRIKTACFATFAYGYFQSSVVIFLPLYLVGSKGITAEQTIVIPAFFAAGMLLFSNVAGRLGDRVGHLRVMRVLAVIGLSMICGFVVLTSYALMCGAVFVAGATLASISPVSLALQGVVTKARDLSRSNAIYNLFYALGMLGGPLISGAFYDRAGGAPMLIHLASIWGAFVVFSVVFGSDDPMNRKNAQARIDPVTS